MTSKIRLSFLGTSGAIPTEKRNHSGILLRYEGENILIDCGEGTQRQIRKAKLNPCKITKILITHWHGDHVLGLPGLFQTLGLSEYRKDLTIYGPKGTKKFVKRMLKTFVFVQKFKLKIIEVIKEGIFFENDDFYLESKKMIHNAPCNAYCFVKKGERRIDKTKLKKTGISPGPLLQKLKQGKEITYKKKKFKSKDLTFKENDLKVCFVLDTRLNNSIVGFAKDSDVLVCDAAFEPGKEEMAKKHFHLTASQAAEIGKKANVKKLILTHISQRYEKKVEDVLKQVNKIFKRSLIVSDRDIVEV